MFSVSRAIKWPAHHQNFELYWWYTTTVRLCHKISITAEQIVAAAAALEPATAGDPEIAVTGSGNNEDGDWWWSYHGIALHAALTRNPQTLIPGESDMTRAQAVTATLQLRCSVLEAFNGL